MSVVTKLKAKTIALYAGAIGLVVGLIVVALSWNLWEFWDGPMPGYQFFLYPGNLTLIYIWHPLFTEEVTFWPKLGLLMVGQFTLVTVVTGLITVLVRKTLSACPGHKP
jgi:hypothetical protein